jgi:hypothetical protein
LEYDRLVICLTQEANHFRMSVFAVDVDVVFLVEGIFDPVL